MYFISLCYICCLARRLRKMPVTVAYSCFNACAPEGKIIVLH